MTTGRINQVLSEVSSANEPGGHVNLQHSLSKLEVQSIGYLQPNFYIRSKLKAARIRTSNAAKPSHLQGCAFAIHEVTDELTDVTPEVFKFQRSYVALILFTQCTNTNSSNRQTGEPV